MLKCPLMAAKHTLVKAAKHISKATKRPNQSPVLPPTVTSLTSKASDGGISNSPAQPTQGEPMKFQLEQLKAFITLMYNKSKADAASKSRGKKVHQTSTCRSSDVAALVALFNSTLSLKSTLGQQHQHCKQEGNAQKAPNPTLTILPQAQSASAHKVTPPTPARLPEPVKPEPHSLPVPKSYPANSGVTQITLSPQTAETRDIDVKMTTTPRSADELSPSQPNEQSMGKEKQPSKQQFSIKTLITQFKVALSLGIY